MAKKIAVAVHPDALVNGVVESALLWSGQITEGKDENIAEVHARYQRRGYFTVRADKFDGDHHFGPTLTFNGPRSPVELTIPWRHVLAFANDKSGKMKIGFGTEPETKPAKRARS